MKAKSICNKVWKNELDMPVKETEKSNLAWAWRLIIGLESRLEINILGKGCIYSYGKSRRFFENPSQKNANIDKFILILVGIFLLLLALLLKSALFVLLVFLFAVAVMILIGLSNNPRKTDNKSATKLILIKVGESFKLEEIQRNRTSILYDNLKWRELIIVDQTMTAYDHYHNSYEVVTARQLQLRIWNEKEQVVLIEKLEKQPVDGIKTFKMKELHKADFVSLEPGTLQKMNALMNVSESIWE